MRSKLGAGGGGDGAQNSMMREWYPFPVSKKRKIINAQSAQWEAFSRYSRTSIIFEQSG
jgi:hypothetical protein